MPETISSISSWANTIYWLGICGALLASLLSLSRLWSANQPSKILSITAAIANLIITLFFFFILWLALIIVSPQEDHGSKIFLGWIGAGLLPTLLALSPLFSLGTNSANTKHHHLTQKSNDSKEEEEETNPDNQPLKDKTNDFDLGSNNS